jgi:acyl dehydratase
MNNAIFPEHLELQCGPVTAVDLALYAAASGDHNPLHLDMEVAHTAGFEKPLVHGMLTMAYAGRLLTERFGLLAVQSLATRFVSAAKLGDTIVLQGTLTGTTGTTGTTGVTGDVAVYQLLARNGAGSELLTGLAKVKMSTGPG